MLLFTAIGSGATFAGLRYFKRQNALPEDVPEKEAPPVVKETMLKLMPLPVLLVTDEYNIAYMNPRAEALFGSPLRRNLGKKSQNLFQLINEKTKLQIKDYLGMPKQNGVYQNTQTASCIVRYQAARGAWTDAWMNVTVTAVEENSRRASKEFAVFFEDTSAARAVESQLNYLERHDSQTGLYNRKAFDSILKVAIDDARKHGSTHVFVSLSIDQFKSINNAVGYAAGDALIERIVGILKAHVRSENSDVVGRLTGNDFGVLFKETTLSAALKKMQAIRDEINDFQFSWNTQRFPVTLSGGFVVIQNVANSSARILTEADLACRSARKHGGNRIVAYRSDNAEMRLEKSNMEGLWNLKKAFENNNFQLFAQPIHPLPEPRFSLPYHHYELLIRMFDDDGNIVPPDEFIPVAEYHSMMPELDRWVVRDAMNHICKVQADKIVPVFAINLSGQSIDEPDFLDFVLGEIQRTGTDPRMVCFEITEAVAVSDLSIAGRFISTLKAKGSSFSLDDFGTGVSSYGYLTSLDVDYLKIDGIFIKNLPQDPVALNIVESVTQVGHSMNLKIIAEFVENDEIIKLLRDMGIDYGQGYGISKPVPLIEMLKPHLPVDTRQPSRENELPALT